MFDSPSKLLLGLISGILFGFLLQKGRVAKFRVIVGQFLFTDWTVVRTMLTAVAVGAVGVWAMIGMGWTELHIKPAAFGGVIVGGVLFGIGMAIFGYCPGTGVAACGEGRRDAMAGVVGMLVGAFVFVFAYPWFEGMIGAWGDGGKITLPQMTGVSPWIYIAGVLTATLLMRFFSERHRTPTHSNRTNR